MITCKTRPGVIYNHTVRVHETFNVVFFFVWVQLIIIKESQRYKLIEYKIKKCLASSRCGFQTKPSQDKMITPFKKIKSDSFCIWLSISKKLISLTGNKNCALNYSFRSVFEDHFTAYIYYYSVESFQPKHRKKIKDKTIKNLSSFTL